MILATSTQRAFGFVILAVVAIGFVVWFFANLRAGRDEVGSEIELAPNRSPQLTDDELERSVALIKQQVVKKVAEFSDKKECFFGDRQGWIAGQAR